MDIFKRCGSSIINYSFPLAINLYALARLKQETADPNTKGANSNTVRGALKFSLRAVKIIASIRGEQMTSMNIY